jgi:nucleotide-binding universal stress UspA family protein
MNILLAVDDSEFSEVATDTLISQCKAEDSEVRLLHVVEPFPTGLAEALGSKERPDFSAARVKQREKAKKLLAHATQKLERAGFTVDAAIEEGDPRNVILHEAEAWAADLIVLGSHGRTGLNHFLIGSVSETVVRHARCSVEIVRARFRDHSKTKREP